MGGTSTDTAKGTHIRRPRRRWQRTHMHAHTPTHPHCTHAHVHAQTRCTHSHVVNTRTLCTETHHTCAHTPPTCMHTLTHMHAHSHHTIAGTHTHTHTHTAPCTGTHAHKHTPVHTHVLTLHTRTHSHAAHLHGHSTHTQRTLAHTPPRAERLCRSTSGPGTRSRLTQAETGQRQWQNEQLEWAGGPTGGGSLCWERGG